MDIYCKRCGEPWEIDTLHEAAEENGSTFEGVRRDFVRRGCVALFGSRCAARDLGEFGAVLEAAADISGEDVDGMAADIEDWFAIGGGSS